MSNLFDVANKNVRPKFPTQKKNLKFWVIAKTRKGYHINQGGDKSFISCFGTVGGKKGTEYVHEK